MMTRTFLSAPFTLLALLVTLLTVLSTASHALTPQQVTTPGGLKAWFIQDRTNPILSLKFSFRGGAALDPIGKEGLSNLVSGLLDEGAGEIDSRTFQQTLEDKSIRLNFDSGREEFSGQLITLVRNQDTAFDLLKLALTKPRFDEEPLERIRAQILVGLRRSQEDPHAIASRTLFQSLYPDHVYGRPSDGTPETVAALTTADLREFVKNRLAKDNLIISVVGDISAEDLGRRLDHVFGDLPDAAASWTIEDVEPQTRGQTIVVEKDLAQSAILFAGKGISRDDPDFYAAYVMNHMLGGGSFTSRLYAEIREKRGLAYSVGTGLYPYDHSALILGSAGTANARAHETLSVLKTEWKKLADEGVTQQELDDAITYLTGSYPLRFSSSGRIASMLVGLQIANLDIDYMQNRNSFIEAVTLDDIKRVAKRLLVADELVTVVVGRPEGIKSSN